MRKRPPVEQLSADTRELCNTLNNESDVACVVIGAAFLDTALAGILEQKFLKSSVTMKLLAPSGVLGNFAARADLAYCLCLISKEHYRDLCSIAEIRNQFAHSHLRLAFGDPKIREICDRLHEWRVMLHGEDEEIPSGATEQQLTVRARNQFNLSVVFIANWLLLKTLELKEIANQSMGTSIADG